MKIATGIKIIVLAGAVALAAETVHANLIVNGNFENGLTGWTQVSSSGTLQIVTPSTLPSVPSDTGTHAALLTITGTGSLEVQTDTDNIPITTGLKYAVSFWLKVAPRDNSNLAKVLVIGDSGSQSFKPTEAWLQYSYVTDALNTDPTKLQFTFSGEIGTKFYLDDVSFAPVPEPTTFLAGLLLLLPFGASALRFVRRNLAFAGDSSKS